MMHDLSSRRIRLIGRDHTAPVYHPVQERETIAPMELTPAHRRMARSLSDAITRGALVAAAVLLVVMIWRGALSAVLS